MKIENENRGKVDERTDHRIERHFSRVPFRTEGELTLLAEPDSRLHRVSRVPCVIETLSMKGVCVRAAFPIRREQEVRLRISLAGSFRGKVLELGGFVLWTRGDAAGILFSDLSPEAFDVLKNILTFNTGSPDRILHELFTGVRTELSSHS